MAISKEILKEFKKTGWGMYIAGLQNSHSGNLSVRLGNRMIITRRGSMLGFLEEDDLVEMSIDEEDGMMAIASTEFHIHREIYRKTDALAVAHAHLIAATALSLLYDEIIPVDVEGAYHIKRVPVLHFELGSGSREMAETLPIYLKDYPIVMVKGHGAFAVGETLEEAFYYCSALENSAKIAMLLIQAGEDIRKYQPEGLKRW
ncbi:MAG: class II aldolase/adducin family protein [Synergistetes bacterium]|nr:class II aldolase/adducin family protein [Synergistota bacterium]MDW8191628.1 class II aldolase/adducin family protein [Synergistota bacterium]